MEPAEHLIRMTHTMVGQIHALTMIMQAMAKSHPDQDVLGPAVQEALQHGLASIEMQPVSDATILGYQHVANSYLNLQ